MFQQLNNNQSASALWAKHITVGIKVMTIAKSTLQSLLGTYDENKSNFSTFIYAPPFVATARRLAKGRETDALSQAEVETLLRIVINHQLTENKRTATDQLALGILQAIFNAGENKVRILMNLDNSLKTNLVSLLTNTEGQRNFNAIIASDAQYARYIAFVLVELDQTHLLTEANFNAITSSDRRYAWGIASALAILREANLLTGAAAQLNFDAIITNGGQYARDIASALMELKLYSGRKI